MIRLEIATLGPLEIRLEGAPLTGLASNKVRALLYHLAAESGRPHRRETLAGLLWPDYPERSARTNLSNALSNLRTALGDRKAACPLVGISRDAIRLELGCGCWVDAVAFETFLARAEWNEAIGLYRGPFLDGFSLSDSPPFEQWTLVVRERLQRGMMVALEACVAACEGRGDYAQAIQVARHQLEIEPWRESAHRALMRALTLSGERASALAQYEACTRVLQEELDVAPSAETVEVYERIRDGQIAPGKEAPRGQLKEVVVATPTTAPLPAATAPVPAPFTPVPPASASPAGERRWVTVLHVEVDQAAALLDEVGVEEWVKATAQALDTVEEQVQRYDGEVVERRAEGAVALFGVATAHEDDPERAVLAALGVQEQVRDGPRLRIGVDAGEALVTLAAERRQVVGRALTLARRASIAAEPGTVSLGENAYRLLQRLFEWEERAKGVAPGTHRPLSRVADVGKGRGIPGLSSPLVGRDEELRALQEAIDRLRVGVGGIVTVVGEAGIGKSRLVAELRKHNLAKGANKDVRRHPSQGEDVGDYLAKVSGPSQGWGVQWVEGRCLSYGGSIAYSLWLDMLQSVLKLPRDAAPAIVSVALRARVQALCADCFDDVYPYLCRLLSLPLEERHASLRDLQGESLRAEVFWAVQTLVESVARRRPLVLVCEDLHWADATSLDLLERVLTLTDRAALLVICVLRPEVEHGCWQLRETAARQYRHRHTDLWLDALTPEESQELVGHLLRVEHLPVTLRSKILDHTGGNPFYVEEILRTLIDDSAIVYDDATGRWQAARQIAEIPIPDTLHGVLAARIDRLDPETRRVLRLASVIGRVFPYRVLAEVAREGAQLDRRLLALQRQQLIRERARLPEMEYIFHHELTQEAAYDGLLVQERLACHRQTAEVLERLYVERIDEMLGLLAYHWERAEEPQRAVDYLLRAGDQARVAYANEEAVDCYRRALALLKNVPLGKAQKEWQLAALKGLGTTYFGVGRISRAEEALLEAISLAEALGALPQDLIRLRFWLGEVLWWEARYDDLVVVADESLALVGEDSESLGAALANHLAAVSYEAKGDGDKALEFIGRTASFIQRLPYVEELRPAYDWIIMAKYGWEKDADEAMRWVHILGEKAALHHDLRALGEAHDEAGEILSATGDLHGALPWYRQSLELYTRIGDTKQRSWPLQHIGRTYIALGDLQRAREYTHIHLKNAKDVGDKRDIALAYRNVGQILLCQGNLREAAQVVEEAASLYREIGLPGAEAIEQVLLGQLRLAQEEHQKARTHFRDAVTALAGSRFLCQRPQQFALAVSGLEEAYHASKAFCAFCQRLRERHPEAGDWPLAQWYLEPTELEVHGRVLVHEVFVADLSPGWTWQDQFGDCSFTLGSGLDIRAANGRDLWHTNLSAPRLLRTAHGDLTIQATCGPLSDELPGIGGLLLWMDRRNFLRLDRGVFGKQDISLMGCVDDDDVIIGRGRLPPKDSSGRAHLQLERRGSQVRAWCSADGDRWYAVGDVAFPVEDPVQVGMHAVGHIDRTVYRGAYPEGTATRFESFELWQGGA